MARIGPHGRMLQLFILFLLLPGFVSLPVQSPSPDQHAATLTHDNAPVIVGFDCNQTEPEVLSVSTLEIEPCPEISTLMPTSEVKYGQIIQKHDMDSVHVFTCQLSRSRFYFKCGGNWINYNVYPPLVGEIVSVAQGKCKDVHMSGYYQWGYGKEPWGDLVSNRTYHFSANEIGWTDEKGYCQGGGARIHGKMYDDVVVQVSYTFSLRDSWGVVDHSTGKINIESTLSCDYKQGHCEDALSGTHTWYPVSQKCPDDQYKVLYQGPYNLTSSTSSPTIILSIQSQPFLFTTEVGAITYVCQMQIQMTEFANIYIVEQKDGSYQLPYSKPTTNDIQFLTYLNSKLTFMYHQLTDSMQKMYISAIHETCKVEREMLKNRIEIIRLNSAAGGLSSLLKAGVFARVNGEVIHLIKCAPLPVSFRQTDNCYDSLPVTYNGISGFLLPNTHILSPYASQIPCSSITPVTYKIGNQWWSYTGTYQQSPNPKLLSPSTTFETKFEKIKSFGQGGMYSSEQIEAIQKLLIFPQLRDSVTSDFVSGITNYHPSPVKFDITSIMSDMDWKKVAKKHMEQVWGYFSAIGNAISGLIGIYFIYRLIKGVLNSFLNVRDLYQVFGCSLYILTAVWGRLAQHFLNKAHQQATQERTPTRNEENEEEAIPLNDFSGDQPPSSPPEVSENPLLPDPGMLPYLGLYSRRVCVPTAPSENQNV